MRNVFTKIVVLAVLFLILILIIFFDTFGISLSYKSVKEIKKNRKSKSDLITELKINGRTAIYDNTSKSYFYTVSDKRENQKYILKLELDGKYKYKIVGKSLNIINVNYKEPIKIIIYNNKFYYETKIQLTNLPIINIKTDSEIGDDDLNSEFNYISPKQEINNNIKIHIRGATSRYLSKKSYKVTTYNNSFTDEKNIQLEDFYYGHSFVLDSLQKDPSKIRNILSTEVWNDVSNDFSNVDINSEFVEVFINNKYNGLYVLTEPINRRTLKLNKSNIEDTSVIIKATRWNNFSGGMEYSISNDSAQLGYEIKYPDDETYYKKIWSNFFKNIEGYYTSSGITDDQVNNAFDYKNYIDIIVFNAFINNGDNKLIKNNYFYYKSLKDKGLYIQPWDMEFTFGLRYTGLYPIFSETDMKSYDEIYTYFNHKYASKTNKDLIKKYWLLRKSVFTKEYFNKLLDKYKNELNKGAALRDSNLWYEYDVEKEIENIRTWIYNRLNFFDEYIRGLEND